MSFRQWLQYRWQEHVDELMAWEHCQPAYTPADYFRKYKWWLRREYKHYIKGN